MSTNFLKQAGSSDEHPERRNMIFYISQNRIDGNSGRELITSASESHISVLLNTSSSIYNLTILRGK